MVSYVVNQTQCPECRKMGNDKSGDNLAVYSDSHVHCFRCGYHIGHNGFSIYNPVKPVDTGVHLPKDSDVNYSQESLKWVSKHGLTKTDLLRNNVLFSEIGIRFNRKGSLMVADNILIFPVWGRSSELLGYQGRYFGTNPGIPKWIGKGDFKNIYNILEDNKDSTIVLVEDIVSAIKVHAAGYNVMPVYGSNIKNRFERLKKLGYSKLILWLDPNMYVKMLKDCQYAKRFWIETRIIFGTKDPKEYSTSEIKQFIGDV